jgi:uncharacterized protein (TIGR02001 family)
MKHMITALAVISALFTTSITYADATTTTYKAHKHRKVQKKYKDTGAITTSAPIPAAAAEEPPKNLTGTFTITSNYLFRGISQSNNLPAFQGGLTYTFLKPGIYFNLWGSNVNITDTAHNDDIATVEIDTIAGIRNSIGEKFSYDINIDRYNYPKASGLNYNELIGVFTYSILSATIGYSSNVFNTHCDGLYTALGVNIPIPPKYIFNFENVSVSGSYGHYGLQKPAGNSYNDYFVQIAKAINIYNLSLQYANTNRRYYNNSLDGPHVVASVTANF